MVIPAMGQAHSDEYQCEGSTVDVADSEINSKEEDLSTGEEVSEGRRNISQASKNQDISTISAKQKQQANLSKAKDNVITTLSNISTISMSRQQVAAREREQQHVRKLSNVSHRNIQLLSMKPRSERDTYAEDLRVRRRSSLINLILGAPSSGPRFSDDLCSLSSHRISECNFGIEFFPDGYNAHASVSSLRLESVEIDGLPSYTSNSKQTLGGFVLGAAQAGDANVGGRGESGGGVGVGVGVGGTTAPGTVANQKRRRSSVGSLGSLAVDSKTSDNPPGVAPINNLQQQKARQQNQPNFGWLRTLAPSSQTIQARQQQQSRKPSLTSTLASIDLTSSFEQHDKSGARYFRPPLCKTKQTIFESVSQESLYHCNDLKSRLAKGRVNQTGRVLRRTGSELSLYSTISANSQRSSVSNTTTVTSSSNNNNKPKDVRAETKLIIMLQVCLPFIFAGFGNMGAGLVLNKVAQWRAFHQVPIFFVLLPPFVGLKGNIEMTLASRLSTLSNLNLLETGYQRKRAYASNLILILSQAIGLSMFAALTSIICEFFMTGSIPHGDVGSFESAIVVVMASALITSVLLVSISSVVMSLAIFLAHLIQVNPDNLSTLIAALYGDVTCVLVYGLIAEWMYSLQEQHILIWPSVFICSAVVAWPALLFLAYKFKETHSIALSSIPPMLTSIIVSMGSGAVLSLVVGRFHLIALYQPVVNGFGANLIAVQASRVSTWLWCSALRRISVHQDDIEAPKKVIGSLASFTPPANANDVDKKQIRPSLVELFGKCIKTILWSFFNSSPNSIAARLLLVMLIPAHTIYFLVIWLLSPTNYIVITWQFYSIYIALCLVQVFILLTICEPLMTLLMRRHLDPDIFGISLLMAMADLIGTLCLAGAFFILSGINDPNAS